MGRFGIVVIKHDASFLNGDIIEVLTYSWFILVHITVKCQLCYMGIP